VALEFIDTMASKNKEQNKKYREKYKERYKEIKRKLVILKGNKCEMCEKEFPLACYDFHHRDPKTKDMELKDLIRIFHKEEDNIYLLEELEKCDLLCSNCHRIAHHGDY